MGVDGVLEILATGARVTWDSLGPWNLLILSLALLLWAVTLRHLDRTYREPLPPLDLPFIGIEDDDEDDDDEGGDD